MKGTELIDGKALPCGVMLLLPIPNDGHATQAHHATDLLCRIDDQCSGFVDADDEAIRR